MSARAAIRDFEGGALAEDAVAHAVAKRKLKGEITRLALRYKLTSEFTSFIAIEERHVGEEVHASCACIAHAALAIFGAERLAVLATHGKPT